MSSPAPVHFISKAAGTLTLTNANTFSGTTTIVRRGALIMGNALALQNSPYGHHQRSGSTLTLFGTPTTLHLGGLERCEWKSGNHYHQQRLQ